MGGRGVCVLGGKGHQNATCFSDWSTALSRREKHQQLMLFACNMISVNARSLLLIFAFGHNLLWAKNKKPAVMATTTKNDSREGHR